MVGLKPKGVNPRNEWVNESGVRVDLVALRLVDDRQQVRREWNRVLPEVEIVPRDQHVLSVQIGFHISRTMRAGALHRRASRETVDAVTQAIGDDGAREIRDARRPVGLSEAVVMSGVT